MQKINQKLRQKYGPKAMRQRLGLRFDTWYQYIIDNQKQQDNAMLQRLGNTILFLSQSCYSKCITPSSNVQQHCVKQCVNDYFSIFKQLADEAKQN